MNKIITISREFGAGGHTIGKRVAQELGIEFYDRDIVRETAKASGFEPELIESEGEVVSRADSILKTICSASSLQFNDTQEVIHDVQQAIIVQLAQKGPCVILGRCANVVLQEAGIDCINVFIHADDVHRAVRVSEMTGSTNATEIQRLMAKKDASRYNYYNHYTGKKWGDKLNYDICINTSDIEIGEAVSVIEKLFE